MRKEIKYAIVYRDQRNWIRQIWKSIFSGVLCLLYRHKITGFICALKSVSKKIIKQ